MASSYTSWQGRWHRLYPGHEIDYQCTGYYWVPGRVEAVEEDGAVLRIRFSSGIADITHTCDLRDPANVSRISPAGTRCCPFVDKQPVDFLHRQVACHSLPASEQWQRAEIVVDHPDAPHASLGGCQNVAIRITSRGDKILGVTYAVPDSGPALLSSRLDALAGGASPVAPRGAGEASPADTAAAAALSSPSSLSRSMTSPNTLGSGSLTSRANALLTPACSCVALGRDTVWSSPASLAPGGSFARWVPGIMDIATQNAAAAGPSVAALLGLSPPPPLPAAALGPGGTSTSSSGASPGPPPPPGPAPVHLVELGRRSRALFGGAAQTTARFHTGGRMALVDYDLVDVLPKPRTGAGAAAVGDSKATRRSARGGGRAGGVASGERLLVQALTALHLAAAAAVAPVVHARRDSMLPPPALQPTSPRGAAVAEEADAVGEWGGALCTRGAGGGGSGSGRAGGGVGTSREAEDCGSARSGSSSGEAPGDSAAAAAAAAELRRQVQFAASHPPQLWYLGRIKWETTRPAAAAAASAPSSPAGFGGGGGGGSKGAAAAPSGVQRPPSKRSSLTSPVAAPAPRPFVYWFEPARDPGSGRLTQSLRRAPLQSMASVAPAGTYTIPFVPGMRLEARRVGGCWAFADVVYADRFFLQLRVHRLPRDMDRNAARVRDVAVFAAPAAAPPPAAAVAASTVPVLRIGSSGGGIGREASVSGTAAHRSTSVGARSALSAASAASASCRSDGSASTSSRNVSTSNGPPSSSAVVAATAAAIGRHRAYLPLELQLLAGALAAASTAASSSSPSLHPGHYPLHPATAPSSSSEPAGGAGGDGSGGGRDAARAVRVARAAADGATGAAAGGGAVGVPALAMPAAAPLSPAPPPPRLQEAGPGRSLPPPPPAQLQRAADAAVTAVAGSSTTPSRGRLASVEGGPARGRARSGSFGVVIDFAAHRRRASQRLPRAGDKDIETVPHQLWQFCIARPGHYCAIEEAAADGAGISAGVVASAAAAGGGGRRQSFFFGLGGGGDAATAAAGARPRGGSDAVIIPPQVATARDKPVSRPRNIFGF